jgi:hypothetical protein
MIKWIEFVEYCPTHHLSRRSLGGNEKFEEEFWRVPQIQTEATFHNNRSHFEKHILFITLEFPLKSTKKDEI